MRITRPVCYILLFLLLTAGSVQAQNWTVGFNLGTAGLEDTDTELDFRFDGRAGYLISPHFMIEAELIRANGVIDTRFDAFLVNAVFNLRPEQAFSPYLLVGAGAAKINHIDLLHLRSDSADGAAFQAAAGAFYYFGTERRLGMRFELSTLTEDTDIFEEERTVSATVGMIWKVGSNR